MHQSALVLICHGYVYGYDNFLAKFNCIVSLCVLILLPRIRADLSETQTRSKGATRRSVHRPCMAMPSSGIDFTMPKPQARNVPSHAHSRLFHQSVPRVRRIRMDIRYIISVHCKKWQNSRRRLTFRQTLYNRHSKNGKTRIARRELTGRQMPGDSSALVERLQFRQLVPIQPTSVFECAEIEQARLNMIEND